MYAYIGLGANLGDRRGALAAGAARLGEAGAVLRRSAIYETAPVGPPQPAYLNAALLLDTPLAPLALLAALLAAEAALGRRRDPAEQNAPRTLDLDLLLLGPGGGLVVREPGLVVPHPRLHERAFALRPLLDLDEGLRHPLIGAPLAALYERCLAAAPMTPAPRPLPGDPWREPDRA
jgi:2-amino-4-hydroxy-6-hydroxymethyldihydropteridine diphosphokinase